MMRTFLLETSRPGGQHLLLVLNNKLVGHSVECMAQQFHLFQINVIIINQMSDKTYSVLWV